MTKRNETGVVIETGARDWQIFQQDEDGGATVRLAGRWRTQTAHKKAVVHVRVMHEHSFEAVALDVDWSAARTTKKGTWSASLRLPRGGPYRLETWLRLDGAAVEWSERGDMRHHLGVGDVWVITGQSNAAGYGKSPVTDGPELGIHMFHADGQWKLASHPLGDSTDSRYPANREGANASHSPWLAFARVLKRDLGYPIGLIPASLGGSPVASWDRKTDGYLFENMLRYIEDSGGGVRGAVWYQGESDTGAAERKLYAKRFGRFVRDLRSCMASPSLPVITAQLNRVTFVAREDLESRAGWEAMREIQRRIAAKTKNVFIIPTVDLGLSDGIHTDSAGNVIIGERMAAVALGGVFGRNIKYRHPECSSARRVSARVVELAFDHVDTRLHYESFVREEIPFAIRDAAGEVPLIACAIKGKDRVRLQLGRALRGTATVTGAPTANPPRLVPFDIAGYRPMLGFTMRVE